LPLAIARKSFDVVDFGFYLNNGGNSLLFFLTVGSVIPLSDFRIKTVETKISNIFIMIFSKHTNR
jgi:hypothetical protein